MRIVIGGVSMVVAVAAAVAAAGVVVGAVVAVMLLSAAALPRATGMDWGGFRAWWRLQTRPLGKGTAVASLNAVWPALRRVLRPDYVWVTYPGTEDHKRAYVPPWVERMLRPVVPTGVMRFGPHWGLVVSSADSAEAFEASPERLRSLLDELRRQFPDVPVALAGRLPSLAAGSGIELTEPFTHGDRGTVCSMADAAREAARRLGRPPAEVALGIVGSKGFIGSRLVASVSGEFSEVIALDSRYERRSRGEDGVLHTDRPEDIARAQAIFVLTPRGTDMEAIVSHIAPGAVVADDTHPEMPLYLRERIEERGATVLKATLGDERFRFVPPIPDFRADDIPGCILEALVIVQRGTAALESQQEFDRAAEELGFRARLAPHRSGGRQSGREASSAAAVTAPDQSPREVGPNPQMAAERGPAG